MIKCKNCGYESDYTGNPCQVCGSDVMPDVHDAENARRELERALKEKNAQKVKALHHLLADFGDTASEREYAKILERSDSLVQSIDTVMDYYFRAAKKNDPYSAYKFSKLIGRSSERSAAFWLKYAAVLGSINSYPDVSDYFSAAGREDIAAYYSSLAAACDDTVSIVNMARRWYDGVGVTREPAHAKWYLDKLTIPPISAIKLAYKLRSFEAAEPPKLVFPEFTKYIKLLSEEARELKFYTAYFYLISNLAKNGDVNAETALGILLTEGLGCEQDLNRGKITLELSTAHGNPAAALYLGEGHLSGKFFEKNVSYAIACFERAAKLGYPDAYEKLGDIYRDGTNAERDVPKAIDLYDRAAAGGCSSAAQKSADLKQKRYEFYLDAYKIINLTRSVTPEEAFSAFKAAAISSAMGEIRAMTLLAKCYFYGFGTERDRQSGYFWFKEAADSGDREANIHLAFCYSRGLGTAFSFKNAVKYLKISKSLGLAGAGDELTLLYKRRMKKSVRALYAQSMELIFKKKYSDAAKLLASFEAIGYPKALYTLGCLYEFGKGVHADPKRASLYYKRAFEGHPDFGNFADPKSDYKFKIMKLIR